MQYTAQGLSILLLMYFYKITTVWLGYKEILTKRKYRRILSCMKPCFCVLRNLQLLYDCNLAPNHSSQISSQTCPKFKKKITYLEHWIQQLDDSGCQSLPPGFLEFPLLLLYLFQKIIRLTSRTS